MQFPSLILVSRTGFGASRSIFRGTHSVLGVPRACFWGASFWGRERIPTVYFESIRSVFGGYPQRFQGYLQHIWRLPAACLEGTCSESGEDPLRVLGIPAAGLQGIAAIWRVLVAYFRSLLSVFPEVLAAYFLGFQLCVLGGFDNVFPWILRILGLSAIKVWGWF